MGLEYLPEHLPYIYAIHVPIAYIRMVYLPIWMVDLYGKLAVKYTSHGMGMENPPKLDGFNAWIWWIW